MIRLGAGVGGSVYKIQVKGLRLGWVGAAQSETPLEAF